MSQKLRKIAIIGCAGAGKTTLATMLGKVMNVPVYHLDDYLWKPGWVQADQDIFQQQHQKLLAQPVWIIDGNHMNTMNDRLAAADLIIFLDRSRTTCLWRAICRWVKHCLLKTEHNQSQITIGLLRYIWRYNRVYRPTVLALLERVNQLAPAKRVIVQQDSDIKGRILEQLA